MTIKQQAEEVRIVKRSESGMIQDPVTLLVDANVGDALKLMKKHKIGGIPIVNDAKELLGIVTNRDLRFQKDDSLPVKQIMTSENIITTKEGTNLENAREILQEHKIEKLPVVNDKRELIGLITYKDITKVKLKTQFIER